MSRFPISNQKKKDEVAIISGNDVKHIQKVLRLGIDDELILFDEYGNEYISKIVVSGKQTIEARITEKYQINRESPVKITLLQGLIKGEKMDLIVQKATELGVSSIVPIVTARSEVKNTRKIRRWQIIADESIKQCARHISPKIYNEKNLENAINIYKSELNLLFYEKNIKTKLKDIYNKGLTPSSVSILIGPEGGFTDYEAIKAQNSGYLTLSLGPRVLRSETASIVSIALIQHIFGDI